MRQHTKLLLILAAAGLIAVGAFGGTFANFTASPVTIGNNAFTTGTLVMSRSGSGAIFSTGAMRIGGSATGSVTMTNSGTLPGVFTLDESTSGSSALISQLTLKIYKDVDNSGSPIYNGGFAGISQLALGTFAASDARTYFFHVTLPTTTTDAGDNLLQGLSAGANFTWSATQA